MTIQIIIIDDNDNLIKLVIVLNLKTYEIAKQIIIIKIVQQQPRQQPPQKILLRTLICFH